MTQTTTTPGIAFVTGANRGIGHAVAVQLAGRGMTVFAGSRDIGRGEAVAEELRASEGADVRAVRLDVTDPATVQAAVTQIDEQVGRVDVLVNNAGISGGLAAQSPGAVDVDDLRKVFETNVFGMVTVTDTVLPLLQRSRSPRIVNVSSDVGSLQQMSDPDHYLYRLPGAVSYPSSKAALNALTIQYAKGLRSAGVLINAAAPGACATDLTKELGVDIPRTAADGATVIVRLATLPDDGPTGGFFDEDGPVPW